MQNPLADELISKCMSITQIGKELNDQGSHTQADAARIERLYFEIGSLVLANLGVIASSLYLAAAMKNCMDIEIPTIGTVKMQIKELTNVDLTKN